VTVLAVEDDRALALGEVGDPEGRNLAKLRVKIWAKAREMKGESVESVQGTEEAVESGDVTCQTRRLISPD